MKIQKLLLPALLSSLLTGCWLLGDRFPQDEIGQVARTNAGFCFQIKGARDYDIHYLSIRDRNAPERSGFNKLRPNLKIADNQLCIPEAYYQFPDSGEIRVDIGLDAPTKMMGRRYIVSEFRIVKGIPHPFTAREYSTLIYDGDN